MSKKKKKITKNPYRQEEVVEQTQKVVEKESTENAKSKKIAYGISMLFFAIGVICMVTSTTHGYGTDLWRKYDNLTYMSVAVGGLVLAYGAKFAVQEKQIKTQSVGLVLFMIATGKLLSNWLM